MMGDDGGGGEDSDDSDHGTSHQERRVPRINGHHLPEDWIKKCV